MRHAPAWIAVLAAVALGAGFALYQRSHRPVVLRAGTALQQARSIPDFAFTDQRGNAFSREDLEGHWTLLFTGFTNCPDVCPTTLALMAGLKRDVVRDDLRFLFVSVDPERDTPEVLKRYAEAHRANPVGWAFLTGTPAEIREVARRYGIYYKKTPRGEVDHTFLTSLVDQSGTLRVQYMGIRFNPDEMLRDLQSLSVGAKAR